MSLRQKGDSLTEDEIFNLLSSSRRRSLLRRLVQDDEPVGLQQLADDIAAEENDKTVDQLTSRERKRVYVSLYQTHVPALADAGVLEYEPDSGRIVPSARAIQLQSHLAPRTAREPRLAWSETGAERDVAWHLANAGLAVLGFAALVIAFTSPTVDVVTNVGAVALGAFGAVAFSLLAVRWTREGLGHRRHRRPIHSGMWVVDGTELGYDVEPGQRTAGEARAEEPRDP